MSPHRIAVVGAGVIGMSSAVTILEQTGCDVTVIADKFTPETLSDGAMGIFEPVFLGEDSPEKITRWGQVTFEHMRKLASSEDASNAGTLMLSGYSIFHNYLEDPSWKDVVLDFRHMTPVELDLYPGHKHGWSYISAITECRIYLPWLMKRFKKNGGKFQEQHINSFDELSEYDVLVNCTGLQSRDLCNDNSLTSCKGQVHRVTAPWVKHFLNADDDDLYILPGRDYVVLGGTHDVDDWSTDISKQTKKRILSGCTKLIPSLQKSQLLKSWVGSRPLRSTIRLETEQVKNANGIQKIVHNYGHGGSGITLHWGCAQEACELIHTLLQDH